MDDDDGGGDDYDDNDDYNILQKCFSLHCWNINWWNCIIYCKFF